MNDNEIRQILIAQKRRERLQRMQRREDIKEMVGSALAWLCWAALIYMAFLGAYMIG